jgi:hypothetical protein
MFSVLIDSVLIMQRIKEEDLELTGVDDGGAPKYVYNGKHFTGILLGYENDGIVY